MKKILLSLMTLFLPLYAQSITAGYDVSFGIVGEIGKAEITYDHKDNDYVISVHAWTTGVASVLSQNRQESYFSQGKIINGTLRPDVFVKFRQNSRFTRSNVFLFDHANNEISTIESKEENVSGTAYDIKSMSNIKTYTTAFTTTEEPFGFYTDNDLLSLFFNTQKILPTIKEGESKQLSAIGSKSPDCIIDIESPNPQKRLELEAAMADIDGRLITIILHQDIFQSEKGELHVLFDDDGFAKNVLLKDVILFGDIRGKRLYQNTCLQ